VNQTNTNETAKVRLISSRKSDWAGLQSGLEERKRSLAEETYGRDPSWNILSNAFFNRVGFSVTALVAVSKLSKKYLTINPVCKHASQGEAQHGSEQGRRECDAA
jgi:hypothetical protein